MKSSIKKFLLVNLLLAITVTTTLTAIGNYYLDEKDIQEHLDTLMAISALSYEALLGDELHDRVISEVQASLNQIPSKIKQHYSQSFLGQAPAQDYLNKFDFQVWTKMASVINTLMVKNGEYSNPKMKKQGLKPF